jgi:hypothetical protein
MDLNDAINEANANNDPEYVRGVEKLGFVREQMEAMWRERREKEMSCPYCLSVVPVGAKACCGTLERAVAAILQAQDVADKLETAQRIAEIARLN